MEKYTAPEMEIILFDDMDVITSSETAHSQNDTYMPEIPVIQ